MRSPFLRLFDTARSRDLDLGVVFTPDHRAVALTLTGGGARATRWLRPPESFDGSVADAARHFLRALDFGK